MNPVKITAKGTTAIVTVEVDLNEWGGKYPDDSGVITRAVRNLLESEEATKVDAIIKLDNAITELQEKKVNLNSIKPEVTLDPDVVQVVDVAILPDNP